MLGFGGAIDSPTTASVDSYKMGIYLPPRVSAFTTTMRPIETAVTIPRGITQSGKPSTNGFSVAVTDTSALSPNTFSKRRGTVRDAQLAGPQLGKVSRLLSAAFVFAIA